MDFFPTVASKGQPQTMREEAKQETMHAEKWYQKQFEHTLREGIHIKNSKCIIRLGDYIAVEADAFVCPWPDERPTGKVCSIVSRTAGPMLLKEVDERWPMRDTLKTISTPSYNMTNYAGLIHFRLPSAPRVFSYKDQRIRQRHRQEDATGFYWSPHKLWSLGECFTQCLAAAVSAGWRTVVFLFVTSRRNSWPISKVAEAVIQSVGAFLLGPLGEKIDRVIFLFDDQTTGEIEAFRNVMA